ncbi:MAG TPA: DUF3108 domain-containing protein [Gemmatimonadaceae bacterium]|nr:DUF3108 domain-containing protein [Gemmatimonadaceae bacterium]
MTLMTMTTALALVASLLASTSSGAQESARTSAEGANKPDVTQQSQPDAGIDLRPDSLPFEVGEKLDYEVKFGAIKVGSARMHVQGIENVRGRPAFHTVFTVRGGTFFYKVNDRYESWMDTLTLSSLRFIQDVDEGSYERRRVFQIFPDRKVYTENDSPEKPSVLNPLDDGSFLYFIRTIPLTVGNTVELNRYFRPDRNPVKIRVLRKERIKVPAGTFQTIVIQPIIKTRGIFADKGEAQVWITDDDRRMMVQLKSKLSFGSLNLYLRSAQQTQTTASQGQ